MVFSSNIQLVVTEENYQRPLRQNALEKYIDYLKAFGDFNFWLSHKVNFNLVQ